MRHPKRDQALRDAVKRALKSTEECLLGGGHTTPAHNPECFACQPQHLQNLKKLVADYMKADAAGTGLSLGNTTFVAVGFERGYLGSGSRTS
jgi:hypothetical protein